MTEAEWNECVDPRPMLEHLHGPESVEQREMFGRIIPVTTHPAKQMTDRKARLFAVACCRQLSDLYDEPHCRRLIDYGVRSGAFEGRGLLVPEADCCLKALGLAEQAADETASAEKLQNLAEATDSLHHAGGDYAATQDHNDEYEHRLVATGEVAHAIHLACSDYPVHYGPFGQPLGAFENLGGLVWRTAQAATWRKGLTYVQGIEGGDPDNMAANATLLRDVVGNPFRPGADSSSWLTNTVKRLAEGIYQDCGFDRLPILADALEEAGCNNADILNHCRQPGDHVRGCWVVDLLLGKE